MWLDIFFLIVSVVTLYWGAEFTLNSAEKIGLYFGIPPLIIGLVLIGFGTSLPEFFVSQVAMYRGSSGIAIGNIVGSNVANIYLILGISGILAPLYISGTKIRNQFFIHLALTVLLYFVVKIKDFGLTSGTVLITFFIFFLIYTYFQIRKDRHLHPRDESIVVDFKTILLLVIGLSFLYGGGELLVSSGSKIGIYLGVSEYVISVVFIAFGTSFPELVTAVMACVKKKNTDLITGNIIGSNIFNVAFVMGSLGLYEFKIDQDLRPEIYLLLLASIFFIILNLLKLRIHRVAGGIFLIFYVIIVLHWTKVISIL
ncbi:MAG: calcium/sodium antiporter [Halobacteriovoraceae bacterium]|nr:calcium/sodium antiporter [Halobacteriovoraceae bacterium]